MKNQVKNMGIAEYLNLKAKTLERDAYEAEQRVGKQLAAAGKIKCEKINH